MEREGSGELAQGLTSKEVRGGGHRTPGYNPKGVRERPTAGRKRGGEDTLTALPNTLPHTDTHPHAPLQTHRARERVGKGEWERRDAHTQT